MDMYKAYLEERLEPLLQKATQAYVKRIDKMAYYARNNDFQEV